MAHTLRPPSTRFLLVITAVVVRLLLGGLVGRAGAADLWDQTVTNSTPESQFQLYESTGQSGFSYRGGTGLPLPAPSGSSTIGAISASTGKGCGIDFAAEFTALFDLTALESYFKGLASSAIAAAPLVL